MCCSCRRLPVFAECSHLAMCGFVQGIPAWLIAHGRELGYFERAWNLLAFLIVLRVALLLHRGVGLRAQRRRVNINVVLAFLPWVDWKSSVPKEKWALVDLANRHLRFVLAGYACALAGIVVFLLGRAICLLE